MKRLLLIVCLLLQSLLVRTNNETVGMLNPEHKLFLITLDGLRWQEVFQGADSALLAASDRNKSQRHSSLWSASVEECRKKLMPFFWTTIAGKGQLFGNRTWGNRMNVTNPYALSYPGYNELLTGRVDLSIFGNGKFQNSNLTVLDFLNSTVAYRGKVAAFASWNAFPYILNLERSRVPLSSPVEGIDQSISSKMLLKHIKDGITENKTTRHDEITFTACTEYIKKKRPSIVMLSLGGTDEAAHDNNYNQYLQQAAQSDRMIGELWNLLQTLPDYAGKTTFIITTDHGRGSLPSNWQTHGLFVSGSSQTWMALLGNGITAKGEQKLRKQLYQKDIKSLMLKILAQ